MSCRDDVRIYMIIIYLILIWLIAMVQIILFNFIPFGMVGINMIFCFMVLLLFYENDYLSLLTAGFGGIFIDLLSGSFFGAWTISLLIIFLIIKLIRKTVTSKNLYFILFAIFLLSIIQLVIYFFYLKLFDHNLKLLEMILPIIYSAGANMILSVVLIVIFNHYKNKKGHFYYKGLSI